MANKESRKLMVDVVARVDKLEKAMKRGAQVSDQQMGKVERRAKTMVFRVDQQFSKLASSIGGLGKAFIGGLAGGALIGGFEGLARGARSVVAELTSIGDIAAKVGLTTDALQQLRHVASLSGVGVNNLDTAMQRFSRRVGEAANGAGVLKNVLQANNVQLRNADGTMRSQVDILRDYANLIKNAGSEQERLLLAFKAFDSEGAALVNVFKDGASAIDNMRQKTEEAGGVIDAQLIKRAAELDVAWTNTWRNFEINSKNAIMTAIDAMTQLRSAFDDYEKRLAAAEAGRVVGGMMLKGDSPENRLAKRMAGQPISSEMADANQKLVEALDRRYKSNDPAKVTVIPQGTKEGGKGKSGSSRNTAAERALREAEAVQQLIDNLSEELRLVGASDVQRAKSNALRMAGAAATAEQREEISRIVEAIYSEREAVEAARSQYEAMNDAAREATGTLVSSLMNGESAADALSNALGRVADRLLNDVLDAIFQINKAGGGGIFGSILGMLGGGQMGIAMNGGIGLYDKGGYTGPGGVKEPAGVVHKGEVVWSQKDVARHGGVATVEAMRRGLAGYDRGGAPGFSMPAVPKMPSLSNVTNNNSAINSAPVINVNVDGATGNAEVAMMVKAGVEKGIQAWQKTPYFANAVAGGVKQARQRGMIR